MSTGYVYVCNVLRWNASGRHFKWYFSNNHFLRSDVWELGEKCPRNKWVFVVYGICGPLRYVAMLVCVAFRHSNTCQLGRQCYVNCMLIVALSCKYNIHKITIYPVTISNLIPQFCVSMDFGSNTTSLIWISNKIWNQYFYGFCII